METLVLTCVFQTWHAVYIFQVDELHSPASVVPTTWTFEFLILIINYHEMNQNNTTLGGVQESRLLYYLIREIKMWLNINHITVHIREELLKLQKLHNKQTSNLCNFAHTHTCLFKVFSFTSGSYGGR